MLRSGVVERMIALQLETAKKPVEKKGKEKNSSGLID